MSCTPPTGLAFLTTMTLGAGADGVVVVLTAVLPVAGAWPVVLLLLLLPPPDCAITNATTATTTTSPSTAQRVPVFIEDLLLSIGVARRTVRRAAIRRRGEAGRGPRGTARADQATGK